MSDMFTPADLGRLRQGMLLGLARHPLAVSEPLKSLVASGPPGRDPTLAVLALAGQRVRYGRPQRDKGVDAVSETARRMHEDARPIMPEAARRALLRLVSGVDKAHADDILSAAGRRIMRAGFRLHPFDLPQLIGYIRNDAASLGLAERAYLTLTAAGGQAEAPGLLHAEITAENWTEFPKAHRVAFLREERRRDPAHARSLLEGAFKSEPAAVRGELLEALTVGLSPADLPFLESLSTDRAESVRAIAKGMVARVPGTPAFDARLADAARCFARSGGGLSKILSRVGLEPEITFKPPQPTNPAEPPGALVGRLFEGLSAEAVAGAAGLTVQELLDALLQDDDTVFAAFMRTAALVSTGGSDGHTRSLAALIEHKLSAARSGSFPSPAVLRSLARNLVQPLTASFSDELLDSPGWQAVPQRFRESTTQSATKDDGTLISVATMLPPSTMRRFLQPIALLPPTTARSAHDFAELVLVLEPSSSR